MLTLLDGIPNSKSMERMRVEVGEAIKADKEVAAVVMVDKV